MTRGEVPALIAEVSMLREHARRAAPDRHRAAPRPERRWEPPTHTRFWEAGYRVAMGEVIDLIGHVVHRGYPATVAGVVELARGVHELALPEEEWLSLGQGADEDGGGQ